MPGVLAQYIPPTDTQKAKALDELGNNERRERKALLDTYWKYYDGEHHSSLVVRPGERDDNVTINLCGQAIDKPVAFFAPKPPIFTLPTDTPQQSDQETPAQDALDNLWEQNDLESFLIDLALAGFVSGHPFVKLLQPEIEGELPGISVLDSRHITAYWDITNMKRPLWYTLQWEIDSSVKRRQDIVPTWLIGQPADGKPPRYDPLSTWVIIEYQQDRNGTWSDIGRDNWDYPFAPIVHW